ncbi:MAG: hypothetical protein ABI345_05525 [Jatrophihabitans sp.]
MEKIDLLVWSADDFAGAAALELAGLRSTTLSRAADLPSAPLLMGLGTDLAGLVQVWVDSVDVWPDLVAQVPGDAYLVTESVPQPVSDAPDLLTHLSWFPKPERLTEAEFFHNWHVVHTPTTIELHPRRQGYVRDAVARTLTDGSPPVRAVVSEFFATEDYMDPARLFGSREARQAAGARLPLYADLPDLSSCPVRRV